ncbi:2,4-dienoyl-CoA reductase (NADPH2) [Desulfitobacterium sp. LBE]|uniref:oxidoreductase n=1 Tax=Desulfitobacterium sp. LBE TaxID=884086 RepID=UPI001199C73B|nr:FAD-dependent oxidoreductase [Desulfitobacterium sp. LBE]TWH59476.1 2,4-dienoyl-CoA reductase (NADPH2) [Desulfitobacterium sp. LBE]
MPLNLFSPGRIGQVELKNRIVMAPMALGYCDKGFVTDRMVEFFRLRARGGVGLICLGAVQIDPTRKTDYDMVNMYDDTCLPGLRSLTDAVHEEGSKIFAQLLHQGRYARSREYNGMEAVAPSAVASRYTGETPRELTLSEIKALTTYYAAGAKRALQAGFDGVELCTNSGYLIGQFLSPLTNQRTDCYNGDLYARMTFLLEIITAVREAVGKNFPITVRLGGNDFMEGGNTNSEARGIAMELEKVGVDALSITGGWHEAQVPQITMEVPHGGYGYLGRGIKESVSIPVIMSNRMNIAVGEKILVEGGADFIAMARPLIADPELPRKAQQGRSDEIRPCVACNQGCLDRIMVHTDVECLGNAEAGKESKLSQGKCLPTQVKTAHPEKILVIGAGAAGLEYARVASARGHSVTIWEQNRQPGGQILMASAIPGRHDFVELANYLICACEKQGVLINYQVTAAKEDIIKKVEEGDFTRVVVATGAGPIAPKIPAEKEAKVVQAWEVLKSQAEVGSNVIIVGAGAVGVETALTLAEIGTLDSATLRHLILYRAETPDELYRLLTHGCKKITLVEMSNSIGKDIGPSTRWSVLARLKQHNVKIMKGAKAISIAKEGVNLEIDGGEVFVPADTVVLAVGAYPANSLYHELKGAIGNLALIGDASKPGKISDAVREAYLQAISF